MKICWDNLEGLKLSEYSKHDFTKKTNAGWHVYYDYAESCSICKEPYLKSKKTNGSCCSSSCHNRLHPKQPRKKRKLWDHGNGYLVSQVDNKIRYIHRYKAEKALGRKLRHNELVHHINMNKKDNRNSNLLICDRSYHQWLHNRMAQAWVEKVGL